MPETALTARVDRNHAVLKKMTKQDDCYVDASPQERIAAIWELTAESAEAGCCRTPFLSPRIPTKSG